MQGSSATRFTGACLACSTCIPVFPRSCTRRTNELNQRWVCEDTWTLSTSAFSVDPAWLRESQVRLLFDGLDTLVDVAVNGHVILQARMALALRKRFFKLRLPA